MKYIAKTITIKLVYLGLFFSSLFVYSEKVSNLSDMAAASCKACPKGSFPLLDPGFNFCPICMNGEVDENEYTNLEALTEYCCPYHKQLFEEREDVSKSLATCKACPKGSFPIILAPYDFCPICMNKEIDENTSIDIEDFIESCCEKHQYQLTGESQVFHTN